MNNNQPTNNNIVDIKLLTDEQLNQLIFNLAITIRANEKIIDMMITELDLRQQQHSQSHTIAVLPKINKITKDELIEETGSYFK